MHATETQLIWPKTYAGTWLVSKWPHGPKWPRPWVGNDGYPVAESKEKPDVQQQGRIGPIHPKERAAVGGL